MEINPYHPPSTNVTDRKMPSPFRLLAHAVVFFYGILFTLFCIVGTIEDVMSQDPIAETVFWLGMSIMTCYGVFALAIPRLRIPVLALLWKYFAYALPVLTYLGLAWELRKEGEMPAFAFAMTLVAFMFLTTPALVFNWMLARSYARQRNSMA